jgi:hypothetical protein
MIVCPIFAALPTEEQVKAFEKAPPGSRKVILATNIAETSITINGIKYVIDTGVVKARGYNSQTGKRLRAKLDCYVRRGSPRSCSGIQSPSTTKEWTCWKRIKWCLF